MGRVSSSCKKNKLQIVSFVLFLVWTSVLAQSVSGATLSLTARWTANTDLDMKEYRLYRTDGTRTLVGSTPHPNTSYPFTVTVQDGSVGTLIFVLTAVDTQNYESADSNLASYSYDLSSSTLSVVPSNGLTSSGNQGGPFSPLNKDYTLTNTGGSSINWTASKGQAWVTLSSAGGTLGPGASTTVRVSINSNANSLTPGPYSDTVIFTNTTNGNAYTTRPVSLTVNTQYGVLSVTSSDGLTSSGIQGGPFNPLSKDYTLTNTGGSSINWTASKGQAWVTLSSAGGTLGPGASTTVRVSINSNANSLTPGPYSDTVSLTNTTNGNGNTTRPVSLTVISTVLPSPPTNVSASDGTYVDRVGVTWTASAIATSYAVYRATYPYNSFAASLGATTGTAYNDTTATPGVRYYYWVKASNAYGTSGFSAYGTGSRSYGTPPPPTNVSASDGTYMDKVQVTWTASAMATSYAVYRGTYPYTFFADYLGSTAGTTFDDTSALAKQTYYYWVKASNAYGTSGFSAYDTGVRADGTPPPPTNVQASDGTYTDRVQVTWTASPNAASYTVYRTMSTYSWVTKTALGGTTGTSFNDTTAVPKITYYYWVKASNAYGTSDFSASNAGNR